MAGANVEETRFIRLETLASNQIALTIWYSYLSRLKSGRPAEEMADFYDQDRPFLNSFGLYATYIEDADSLIENLNLPDSLKKMIKNSLNNVTDELNIWTKSFKFSEFGTESHGISQFDENWCVWTPNCAIDYKKTAVKMVSNSDGILTEIQKFAIMSLFCLVEEIEAFELDSLGDFIQKVQFNFNPEIFYWIRYKRNMLNTIPRSHDFTSLDAIMAACYFNSERISTHRVQFFYQRLGANDQVSVVKKLLLSNYLQAIYPKEWIIVNPLILKMTLDQQRRLFRMHRVAERIIIYSARYSSLEYALWAWRHSKESMSARTFSCILKTLIKGPRQESTMEFAVELWDTSSDAQKRDVLNDDMDKDSVPVLIIKYLNLNATAYQLLNRYLASKSSEYTREFFRFYIDKMALRTDDPELLRLIWNLYFPNRDYESEFWSSMTISEKMMVRFGDLWCRGEIDTLNANLEFYFSGDVTEIRKYKAEIVQMMRNTKKWDKKIDSRVIADAKIWLKFCGALDSTFEDAATSTIAKKHFVSRFLDLFRIDEHLRKGFDHVRKVLEELFADQELNNIKKSFLFNHTQPPSKYWLDQEICDVVYFHKVIEWCCCSNNQEDVLRFKEWCEFPDNIFDLCFFHVNKLYSIEGAINERILERLNKYLKWYMKEEELKGYKQQKLDNREHIKIFTAIKGDERSMQVLLEWFFDDDAALVRDFRTKKMRRE